MSRTIADWLVETGMPENRFLEDMERILPWEHFEAFLHRELPLKRLGRPPYPSTLMFRMLLLQHWYGLSDVQVEFQCADRLSFRKFLGLGITDKIPDATTVEDFRHKLNAGQLQEKLLAEIDELLQRKGLIGKQGTLVDATFVKAANPKADPERKTGHKGNGYSGSVAVARKYKFVRKVVTTNASVHDSQPLEPVLPPNPGQVYADLAYWGEPCQQVILKAGGTPKIPYKKPKHGKLEPWQQGVNAILARCRSGVEHVFARMKTQFHMRNSRYSGLSKVHGFLCSMALAYNCHRLGFVLRRKPGFSWA